VIVSIGTCIGYDIDRLFILKKPGRLAETYPVVDGWMTYAATPTRGVFLKFDGFNKADAGYAQNIYFRGVFVLFPRPLLVSDPHARINNGYDLLKNNWYPSDPWLAEQGVGSVLTVQMDRDRNLPITEALRWLGR